jgi:uncharacterized membrane protein
MATVRSAYADRKVSFQIRYLWWIPFGLMTLFVLLTRDRALLDSQSFLRQRYAPYAALMFAHGVPGVLALFLGPFQFSNRLRLRFIRLHRAIGRTYVGSAFIAAPLAIVVSILIPIPGLLPATLVHSGCWIVTTAAALYCVLTGRIQQHREWMMRSYPFAAVFVITRTFGQIPAIQRMGLEGNVAVVWTSVALAGIVPSFLIAWQAMPARKRVAKPQIATAND